MKKKISKNLNFIVGFLDKTYFILLFLLTILMVNTLPAHAYAGPGVAIGAILVLFTVIFAFFGSIIIRIFNLIKRFTNFFFEKIIKNLSKKSKRKKSDKR